MNILPNIVTPISANWPAWMLTLFSLIAIVLWNHRRGDAFQNLLDISFRWGTLSLALFVMLYDGGPFTFVRWLQLLALVIVVDQLKMGLLWLTCYVFEIPFAGNPMVGEYQLFWFYVCLCCIPITALAIWFPGAVWIVWTGAAILISLVVWIIWRSIRLFLTKLLDLLYIIIYTATVEVLPIWLVIYIAKQWITL